MSAMPKGQPRSVPDPDGDAYDQMLRSQRKRSSYWDSRPGLAESVVPVWGSAREAIADAREGDVLGAVVNTGLAASDLVPGAFIAKGLSKPA
jgi:hypothetical protein